MFDTALFSRHLEDDETVTTIVHAHWLIGIKFLVFPLLSFFLSVYILAQRPVTILFYAVSLWSIGSLVWLFRNICDYYLDVWIITDQAVIDLAWLGWFHRKSTRILYSDIQGVSHEINGIPGTLFRYGTVSVEKISNGATVSLAHVARPKSVEATILKNMESYLHTKNLKNSKQVQEILAEFVAREMHVRHVTGKPSAPPRGS